MSMLEQQGTVMRQSATVDNPLLLAAETPSSHVTILTNVSGAENATHFTLLFENRYMPVGFSLAQPIQVVVWCGRDEVVIAEPTFAIHAAGDTLDNALLAFGSTLVEDYTMLAQHRAELGDYLLRELEFLTTLLGAAEWPR